jgi:hypothetical protein
MGKLDRKAAIVTGAARGLGRFSNSNENCPPSEIDLTRG